MFCPALAAVGSYWYCWYILVPVWLLLAAIGTVWYILVPVWLLLAAIGTLWYILVPVWLLLAAIGTVWYILVAVSSYSYFLVHFGPGVAVVGSYWYTVWHTLV